MVVMVISASVYSQNIPAKPNPPRLVNDFAGVLSGEQKAILEQKLVALDDSTSNQVSIVLIKTLADYPIEDYAVKLFRGWGIGNKKNNNGVLIIAAIDDHKIRIEVGYGLEGAIPDITANSIIENDIVPAFREQNYYRGLNAATDDIGKAASGEYQVQRQQKNDDKGGGGSLLGIIIIIFIVIFLISRGGRGGRGGGMMSRRGYGGLGPFIWGSLLGNALGNGNRGGWSGGGGSWGGGSSGGGFGGFGGGSSGGGGASGSW